METALQRLPGDVIRLVIHDHPSALLLEQEIDLSLDDLIPERNGEGHLAEEPV